MVTQLLCLCFVLLTSITYAGLSKNLTGTIELSSVNSQSDTLHEQSLNQRYSLYWQKSLTPFVIARSSLTYYNFGIKQNLGTNGWRKEFSPAAELLWKHPDFNLGGIARRSKSSSNDLLTNLTTDYLTANLKTRLPKYPYLDAQFQQTEVYNSAGRNDRDTRDRAWRATTGYSLRNSSVTYGFVHRNAENRIDRRRQLSYQHSLRLNQSLGGGKDIYTVSAAYRLDYRTQSDISPATENLPREIPELLGLYTNDATPDLSSLDTIPSLVDGILTLPTSPQIDIGNGNINWNIGADLGFTRSVSRVSIYTDRPSGNGVRWQVYKSPDNVVWSQVVSATSLYSVGFSRYEISFHADTTRYIKVVNSGLNEVASVFVTEIEALIDIGNQSKIRRHQTTHAATLSNSFRLTSKWTSSADISLRRESGSSLAALRSETNYGLSTRYKMSAALQSGVRYELGLTDFGKRSLDINKSSSISYDLQYRPLETLAFLLSMASRHSYIRSMKAQELNNASARATGDPLARLHLSTELGWSRNNLYLSGLRYDTWVYNISMNGTVYRRLDAGISYVYQRTAAAGKENDRAKNQYAVNFNLRPTGNLMLQGSASLVNDFGRRNLAQDYVLSWTASSKLSASASASLTGLEGGSRSDRYSAQLQYSLTPRSSLVVSYSQYDLSSASGSSASSLQAGFRTGF